MKSYKVFLVVLLALAAVFFTGTITTSALAEEPQQKKAAAPAADSQEEETPYDDVEYNAFIAASQETDLEKRGPMLLAFMEKYPKSALMPNVNGAYVAMMKECAAAKKFELLRTHAEKWLKLHPGDRDTLAFIALATRELKEWKRCAECYEEIYKMQPSATMARDIFDLYRESNNLQKELEWFDKLAKMPEFNDDYALRFSFALKYMESKNLPRAAEFAQLTLKATDQVKQPDKEKQENIQGVRRACYDIIGGDLMDKDKFQEAIPHFKKSNAIKKTGQGYYNIALCLHKQKEIDDAMIYYAAAEVMGGDGAAKAKSTLEELFKALHNGNLTGIEKVYTKAKKLIADGEIPAQ